MVQKTAIIILLFLTLGCDSKELTPPKYDIGDEITIDWSKTYKPDTKYLCPSTGVISDMRAKDLNGFLTEYWEWFYYVEFKCKNGLNTWMFDEEGLEVYK